MQMRNAARVLPEPVGAEMSVGRAARMAGQPSICGSVAEPNRERNHSWMMGWAHARASAGVAGGADCIWVLYPWASCFIRPNIHTGRRAWPSEQRPLGRFAGFACLWSLALAAAV